MRSCSRCGKSLEFKNKHARFCSDKCRNYARREALRNPIPGALLGLNRWVRWKSVARNGRFTKVPITAAGRAASSTDSSTWTSYALAKAGVVGSGVGFVLNGDGIGCVDLDHVVEDGVVNPLALDFLSKLDAFYVEYSPSGDGIHAWVFGGAPDGRKVFTTESGLKVEWYSDGRYITVTGNVIR